MSYEKLIEKALNSEEVLESLREVALLMHKNGVEKKEIYDTFHNYYLKGDEKKQETTPYEHIYDILDMLTGWYVGRNFDF